MTELAGNVKELLRESGELAATPFEAAAWIVERRETMTVVTDPRIPRRTHRP